MGFFFLLPWPTELHETRTSLKNGPDAFHCEERLGKENFEIKFKMKRKELFISVTLNVTIYELGQFLAVLVFCINERPGCGSNSVLAPEALGLFSVRVCARQNQTKTQQGMFGVPGHHPPAVPSPQRLLVQVRPTLPNGSQHRSQRSLRVVLCSGGWEFDSVDVGCAVLVGLKANINYV